MDTCLCMTMHEQLSMHGQLSMGLYGQLSILWTIVHCPCPCTLGATEVVLFKPKNNQKTLETNCCCAFQPGDPWCGADLCLGGRLAVLLRVVGVSERRLADQASFDQITNFDQCDTLKMFKSEHDQGS